MENKMNRFADNGEGLEVISLDTATDEMTPEQAEAVREMKQEAENPIKKEERLYASV